MWLQLRKRQRRQGLLMLKILIILKDILEFIGIFQSLEVVQIIVDQLFFYIMLVYVNIK